MTWLFEIGIFAASILAGLVLGGFLPGDVFPKIWQLRVAAVLVGIGFALAVIGFS